MTKNEINKDLIENEFVEIVKSDKIKGVRLLIGYLGIFVGFIGLAIMLPCLVTIFYREDIPQLKNFLIPGGICLIIGLSLYLFIVKKNRGQLRKGEDSVLLVLIWITSSVLCSIPFMCGLKMNFTQAMFECTSGLTTTGLTIVNVENTPKIFLMYRSILQFLGGVGLVLIITATISDKYGVRLYSAEGHESRLLPNMAKSARMILSIYIIYITVGALLFIAFGMPIFDSINHSISAIATGGFSVKAASIGAYEYLGQGRFLGIQIVACILMMLGGTNFLIHSYIIKGKFKNVFLHSETKYGIISFIVFFPIFVLAFNLVSGYEVWDSIRISFFQIVSSYSTTGYQVIPSVSAMPSVVLFATILLMMIGGEAESTAGGIKQIRMVSFVKGIFWDIKARLNKGKVVETHFINSAGKYVEITDKERKNNNDFILIMLLITIIATLIVTACGYSLQDSLFEVTSAFSSGGLSVGVTKANANPIVLWTLSSVMFLGRLEIYVVFIALFRAFQLIKESRTYHGKFKRKR